LVLAQVGPDAAERLLEYGGAQSREITFLGALMSWASVVVAPSTGPLHVAVALGRPVVTFYPPVRVMSALRWGPYLKNEARATVHVPDVYCGQDFQCRGSLCHYYPCMRGLTVDQAVESVRQYLEEERQSNDGEKIGNRSAAPNMG
jgi:ADP-heptose:LPS heptosyltransferase